MDSDSDQEHGTPTINDKEGSSQSEVLVIVDVVWEEAESYLPGNADLPKFLPSKVIVKSGSSIEISSEVALHRGGHIVVDRIDKNYEECPDKPRIYILYLMSVDTDNYNY